MNRSALIKGLKEVARLVIFALPGILIQVISGDAALSAAYGGPILVILKGLDKTIHESPTVNAKGIVPF